jgi:hypothetical protein
MPTEMTHSQPLPTLTTMPLTGRPEMEAIPTKFRSRTLFGLPAGNAPAMKAAYPLCDRAGAPACGNVGQPGRPDAPVGTRVQHETEASSRGD